MKNGDLSTLVHVGTVDAPEFKATTSTPDIIAPVVEKTKGLATRIAENATVSVPPVLPLSGAVRVADPARLSIQMTDETVLKGILSLPLFTGLIGLAALILAFSAMWYREGR